MTTKQLAKQCCCKHLKQAGKLARNSLSAVEERVAILLGMFQAKETWISSGRLGLWLVYVSPTNVIKKLTTNNNNNNNFNNKTKLYS